MACAQRLSGVWHRQALMSAMDAEEGIPELFNDGRSARCRFRLVCVINNARELDPESSLLAQFGDVFRRRIPEKAAVFSAELRSAQIPHALTRSTRVHHGRQH